MTELILQQKEGKCFVNEWTLKREKSLDAQEAEGVFALKDLKDEIMKIGRKPEDVIKESQDLLFVLNTSK